MSVAGNAIGVILRCRHDGNVRRLDTSCCSHAVLILSASLRTIPARIRIYAHARLHAGGTRHSGHGLCMLLLIRVALLPQLFLLSCEALLLLLLLPQFFLLFGKTLFLLFLLSQLFLLFCETLFLLFLLPQFFLLFRETLFLLFLNMLNAASQRVVGRELLVGKQGPCWSDAQCMRV